MIKEGSTVSVHYTGKLKSGEVFDSSIGKDPLSFTVGSGQIIPGFEKAIIGKTTGEKITTNIIPSEAYGDYRNDLLVEVPIENMPGPVEVGQTLQAQSENGMPLQVKVAEVHQTHVVIDGNHPLSGKDLIFDIEILEIA